MKKDFFDFENDSSKPENKKVDLNSLLNDEDFEIFKNITPEVDENPVAEEEAKGNLDDSLLSDDFIIGQDFFIDSTVADGIETESAEDNSNKKTNGKTKKKKKKKSAGAGCLMSVIWMASIFIISITAATVILYFGMDYLGVSLDIDSAEESIEVSIPEGTSVKQIANILEEKGVIDSPLFFRFYAGRGDKSSKFSNGVYYFSKQDGYEDIVDKLIKNGAKAQEVKITIPEGFDVDQIAERLEINGVCTAAQFKQAVNEATYEKYNFEFMKGIKNEEQGVHYRLEGYLFPDTYNFYQSNSKKGAEQAIRKMLQNFDKKLDQSMRVAIEEKKLNLHDVVTLASMIEMEASVAKYSDKQGVSAVFWNRLKDSKTYPYLQSDPTTDYPYNKDKYDTYKAKGLAPGAYCSPGIDSLKAAINPKEGSENYYFVTDKNMKFYFNKTNDGHNKTIKDLKNKGLWVEVKKD